VGGIGRFRPVPPHAGHFDRIKATPSDLPFKSTGFATYPVPPQFGQSFGLTPLPLSVEAYSPRLRRENSGEVFGVTNREQEFGADEKADDEVELFHFARLSRIVM
jgi:hypothetical protein